MVGSSADKPADCGPDSIQLHGGDLSALHTVRCKGELREQRDFSTFLFVIDQNSLGSGSIF